MHRAITANSDNNIVAFFTCFTGKLHGMLRLIGCRPYQFMSALLRQIIKLGFECRQQILCVPFVRCGVEDQLITGHEEMSLLRDGESRKIKHIGCMRLRSQFAGMYCAPYNRRHLWTSPKGIARWTACTSRITRWSS